MSGPTGPIERLRPLRARGQNFLRNLDVKRRIVSEISAGPEDVFLEIGAGSGELTLPLVAGGAKRILAIEADPALSARLNQALETEQLDQVEVIEADFLALDLCALLVGRGLDRVRAIGNLPYSVASPILRKLLSARTRLVDLILMFQSEVAERLVARPSTKAYGFLSVITQQAARVEILHRVPPSAFWPQPKVTSALVRMELRREDEPLVGEQEVFQALVKALMAHRRKNISNNLKRLRSPSLKASDVQSALDRLNIDPSRRGESLSVKEFAALSHFCSSPR